MAQHNIFGKIGEDFASEYLIKKGYIIRDRNWRFENIEVDIVAEKKNTIIIVEVKTRKLNTLSAIKSIDQKKQTQLLKAANIYTKGLTLSYNAQIDVICVIGDNPENFRIEHIPNAIRPKLRHARGRLIK